MEFEDEHDEEQEEEEDDEEEITIPPPSAPPTYDPVSINSLPHRVARVTPPQTRERRSGSVRYRECLKNHAVNIGGHAVDGCGEFMAAGEEGTLDALKCAACNCHRNFHRKEMDNLNGGAADAVPVGSSQQPAPTTPPLGSGNLAGIAGTNTTLYPQFSPYYRTPAPPSGYLHVSSHHHRPLAVLPSSTSGGTHSGDDMSLPSSSGGGGGGRDSGGGMRMSGGGSANAKKRFRTKFSQDQKDKMQAFAEKVGWRIQKHDEAAVQQFCAEVQVKRQVLKVWMHNNKHTLGKKNSENFTLFTTTSVADPTSNKPN